MFRVSETDTDAVHPKDTPDGRIYWDGDNYPHPTFICHKSGMRYFIDPCNGDRIHMPRQHNPLDYIIEDHYMLVMYDRDAFGGNPQLVVSKSGVELYELMETKKRIYGERVIFNLCKVIRSEPGTDQTPSARRLTRRDD